MNRINRLLLGSAAGLAGAALCAFAGTIQYSYEKEFSFAANINAVPNVTAWYFVHAINSNGTVGAYSTGQAAGFNGLKPDAPSDVTRIGLIDARSKTDVNIFNQAGGAQGVPVRAIKQSGLGMGAFGDTANATDSTAAATGNITNLGNKIAEGDLKVNGSIPEPAAGQASSAFALSFEQVSAKVKGGNVIGTYKVKNGNQVAAPKATGSTALAQSYDPITVDLLDDSDNILASQTLFASYTSVLDGEVDWTGTSLSAFGDDVTIFMTDTPAALTDPSGSLFIHILGGALDAFVATGSAFSSCSVSKQFSAGVFSCSLPTDQTFNLDYSHSAIPYTSLQVDAAEAGLAIVAPEPGTLSLLAAAMGLGFVCLYRRR